MPSVSAYVSFVLRQVITNDGKGFDEKEMKELKERLKALGY